MLLQAMRSVHGTAPEDSPVAVVPRIEIAGSAAEAPQLEETATVSSSAAVPDGACMLRASASGRFGVLDVETRRSATEVGGWHNAGRMGVSIAVLYDSGPDAFTSYTQEEIPALASRLAELDLVVGFNIIRFDYQVLEPHAPVAFSSFPTLDMLMVIHARLSYRVSLDNLARHTLGTAKSADGLQALAWWKAGNMARIEEYCRQDVAVTRDLYLFGQEKGYVLSGNKAGQIVRIPVRW